MSTTTLRACPTNRRDASPRRLRPPIAVAVHVGAGACAGTLAFSQYRIAMTANALHDPVRLRPTMLSDLDFVISVEQDAANLPFITPWERTQHEGAVRFPDFRHFIVEAGPAYERAGCCRSASARTASPRPSRR